MAENQKSIALTAAAVVAVLASSVRAAVPVPAGLNPGDKYNLVFVSLTTGTAISQDINTYDQIVTADAAAHGLGVDSAGNPVTWKVLASVVDASNNVTTAVSRFDPATPIYRLDGIKFADSGPALWSGVPAAALDIAPDGSTVISNVWTGSKSTGQEASGADGSKALGNTGPLTEFGHSPETDGSWIQVDGTLEGNVVLPYYAFSSELTVPAPEPASVGLLGLGLAALGMRGKRR